MKYLTKRQKITIALVIGMLLVGTYFWGVRLNKSNERITPEEVKALKEKENSDLISLNKKPIEKIDDENKEDIKEFEITSSIISSDVEEAKPGSEQPNNKDELKQIAKEKQEQITEEERKKLEDDAKKLKQEAIAATTGGEKDKYQTSPVPEGKPKPIEPEDVIINKDVERSATISIKCDTILDNMDIFNMDKIDVLPLDGVILPTTEVTFYEGESVYDVILRVTRERRIHMESVFTPGFNSAYIEGINNIYEFDCGENSGWMYNVNGWFPNYGCSRYLLGEGDVINWVYTCSLGKDVGDNSMLK